MGGQKYHSGWYGVMCNCAHGIIFGSQTKSLLGPGLELTNFVLALSDPLHDYIGWAPADSGRWPNYGWYGIMCDRRAMWLNFRSRKKLFLVQIIQFREGNTEKKTPTIVYNWDF